MGNTIDPGWGILVTLDTNLDIHVNGEKRNLKFRVENFEWDSENGSSENLIGILRDRILNYDSDWELYHIGTPFEDRIPVTFRYKNLS